MKNHCGLVFCLIHVIYIANVSFWYEDYLGWNDNWIILEKLENKSNISKGMYYKNRVSVQKYPKKCHNFFFYSFNVFSRLELQVISKENAFWKNLIFEK